MAVRPATTRFTRSHKVGKREILQDSRSEFIPTNCGFVRPDGPYRLIAEVSRLGDAEVERLMLAFHRKFKRDRIGIKAHGMSIDLRRDGNPDIAMEIRFPARELADALKVLNSKPRDTSPKQREANRQNAVKAVAARAEKRESRKRAVADRLGAVL